MSNFKISNQENVLSNFNANNKLNVYLGEVVSIDDPLNAGRIKVRIPLLDINKKIFCKERSGRGTQRKNYITVQGDTTEIINNTKQLEFLNITSNPDSGNNGAYSECSEITWSTPLLPRHFQNLPKVGELVKVIVFDINNPNLNREWIGPIVSSRSKYSYDMAVSAAGILNTSVIPTTTDNTNTIELNKRGGFTGGFSEPLDISINSRNNADIVLPTFDTERGDIVKNGEVLIRAGKLLFDDNSKKLKLNDQNPAYIRLKVLTNGTKTKNPDTHTMMFSDYFSIISHKNGEEGGNGITKINPIVEKDTDIERIHSSLQPLVRGNFLIEFLELLRDYVANHNHPYTGLPATDANSKPDILKFDLNKILSTNIRIN